MNTIKNVVLVLLKKVNDIDFILLTLEKYPYYCWGSPAGGIVQNEQPVDALFREFYEETNTILDPDIIEFINHFVIDNTIFFIVELFDEIDFNPINNNEVKDVQWVDFNDFLYCLIFDQKIMYDKNNQLYEIRKEYKKILEIL